MEALGPSAMAIWANHPYDELARDISSPEFSDSTIRPSKEQSRSCSRSSSRTLYDEIEPLSAAGAKLMEEVAGLYQKLRHQGVQGRSQNNKATLY